MDEELTEECEVVGVLPAAVYGEFARNGPNPRFAPAGRYHWFDGDGMVRVWRAYCCTFFCSVMWTILLVITMRLFAQ